MNKISLKLHEFYQLEAELNGATNTKTGEVIAKGLLNEKIKLTTKYWLSDLLKKVAAEKESIEKIKEELIKKYGTTDDEGNVGIQMYVKDDVNEVNPEFTKFRNDFNLLLNEDRDLEYKSFKLEDFDDVETDGNYIIFFKLVTVND